MTNSGDYAGTPGDAGRRDGKPSIMRRVTPLFHSFWCRVCDGSYDISFGVWGRAVSLGMPTVGNDNTPSISRENQRRLS